jgi:hypothetical protein
MFIGKMSIGKMSIGKMSVGQMPQISVGQMPPNKCFFDQKMWSSNHKKS